VQLLTAKGNSAVFRNAIIPSSAVSVPTRGRVTVTKGTVELQWSDVNGRPRAVRATPEKPGEWDEYIRTLSFRKSGEENGFLMKLVPLDGTPAQAEGVVIDVVYGQGARAAK